MSTVLRIEKKRYSRKLIQYRNEMIYRAGLQKMKSAVNLWLDLAKADIIKGINRTMIRKDIADQLVIEMTGWEVIENEGKKQLKPVILGIIGDAGTEGAIVAGLGISFDVLTPHALDLAETITAKLVTEVTEETKAAIRWEIRNGIEKGRSMPQIGRILRPKVGLTERQMKSVANFEERLLIDKPHFTREQIDRATSRYEKRLHRGRNEMIARTETATAVSEGSLYGYEEAGETEVVWLVEKDDALCEICAPRDGQRFPIQQAHGMIPAHPN